MEFALLPPQTSFLLEPPAGEGWEAGVRSLRPGSTQSVGCGGRAPSAMFRSAEQGAKPATPHCPPGQEPRRASRLNMRGAARGCGGRSGRCFSAAARQSCRPAARCSQRDQRIRNHQAGSLSAGKIFFCFVCRDNPGLFCRSPQKPGFGAKGCLQNVWAWRRRGGQGAGLQGGSGRPGPQGAGPARRAACRRLTGLVPTEQPRAHTSGRLERGGWAGGNGPQSEAGSGGHTLAWGCGGSGLWAAALRVSRHQSSCGGEPHRAIGVLLLPLPQGGHTPLGHRPKTQLPEGP